MHPEGVLQYSTIESVMLFYTMDELQITAWGVVKVMTLCDEAIRVRTSPPSSNHMRVYMAVVTGKPSGIQPPPSNGEEEPHTSPSNPHLGGRSPQHLKANLGNLRGNELQQLMEELCREITLWELNATPPSNPPQTLWGNPMGSGDPDANDWEVTFPRGGGWVPPEPPFWPPAPTQPDGGWEPSGQPPCPPAPVQPDEDVGHLINTLAMGLWLSTPWIKTFSSDAMPGKMEVSFEHWYHEVQCVKDHCPKSMVRESIVHSLKGAVMDMARYMGPTTSMAHILQKLTVIFGTVVSFDVLMQNCIKLHKATMRRFHPLPQGWKEP